MNFMEFAPMLECFAHHMMQQFSPDSSISGELQYIEITG
jgi:hypothetical protein